MRLLMHPALRSLTSRRGPLCFGDVSTSDPTLRSYSHTIDRNVQTVLNFVNRFAPPNWQFQTMEQVAADHTLFGSTLDEEERIISHAELTKRSERVLSGIIDTPPNDHVQDAAIAALGRDQASVDADAAALDDFRAQRARIANAIITFRRFGYDGLGDPDLIPDSESYKSGF